MIGFPRILISDQGRHFINRTVRAMTEELQIQHKKSTPYHLQANGTVEEFNIISDHPLTKVCNANRDYWDLKISAVLWAYRTTCKRLRGETLFKLVYGQEVVIPMDYIVPSLRIVVATCMDDEAALEDHATQLIQLEEDHFIAGFHQHVKKD